MTSTSAAVLLLIATSCIVFAEGRNGKYDGWYYASNGCYYKGVNKQRTYDKAKKECEKDDARLASQGLYKLDVAMEVVYVSGQIPSSVTAGWVGIDDLNQANIYEWSDGTTLAHDDFLWDDAGYPNGMGHCGSVTRDGIRDDDCNRKLPFICEYCP